ncbi:MAG: hypothetical protein L6263_05050 [Desulfobacteraceae bacterium]|nr:hypothetical protein [Desulfobacteraceae bacterium]MCG2831308.1 hypothetical protein [Desulfobacteraceae bacterium]
MPRVLFCYKNEDVWEKIGQKIEDKITVNNDYQSKKDNGDIDDEIEFLIAPLFEFDSEKNEITSSGLEIVKRLRLADKYNFRAIFLVTSEFNIPDIFNPHKTMYDEAVDIIKNPEFGDTLKAVLLGEIVSKKEDNNQKKIMNILNINSADFVESLKKLIKGNDSNEINFRKRYYDVFVKFYKPCETGNNDITIEKYLDNIGNKDKHTLIDILNQAKLDNFSAMFLPILDFANEVYNFFNGTGATGAVHRVKHELFRAPIPFPLQELIDAKSDIESRLHKRDKKKTIKLLLIDNKLNKVIDGDNFYEGELIRVLFDREHCSLFELKMLVHLAHKKEQGIKIPRDNIEYEKLEKEEKFDFKKFKKGLDEIYATTDTDRERNYAWLVYEKIKESHFVLLDFFLNQENTYLAFDFIKDMAAIKRQEGDVSTTWYFITSAVYDSVVKYSQSGLLAEYYESAVVNAGDDPTNKKRQIIFLYKLLTFINARFANFKKYKDSIHEKLFADLENDEAKPYCKTHKKKESECGKEECLRRLQDDIKRYLTEYNSVCSIFYDEKDDKPLKVIVESLDNVIKQFIWLPEADWYMIQHQIDFINNKLSCLQDKSLKKCKFSCNYILKELEDRSEVY